MPPEDNDFRTVGQLIQHLLDERGWTQTTLAVVLGEDSAMVNRLVHGRQRVTAKIALALAEVFGVPPDRFLDLQKKYDLAKAGIEVRPDPGRATRAHLYGSLPIAEMMTRGWLDGADDIQDVPAIEAALARFFGVMNVSEIEILPHAAKKTNVATSVTPVQLAWLHRVRSIASEMIVPRYSSDAALAAVPRLSALLSAPEEARRAPRILAEAGIRYVVVESLSSAGIDGVCFWLDSRSPVIGMTLRFDRIDNFWWVLRHELEHVIRGHGRATITIDAGLEGERAGTGPEVAEEERIANAAASEFCVPRRKLNELIARKAPFFTERDILGFARTLNLHPGLVAGQLQHATGRYDRFRKHLVKIRSAVAPSAVVDGWGDVAPVGT